MSDREIWFLTFWFKPKALHYRLGYIQSQQMITCIQIITQITLYVWKIYCIFSTLENEETALWDRIPSQSLDTPVSLFLPQTISFQCYTQSMGGCKDTLSTTRETQLSPSHACPTDSGIILITTYNMGNLPFQKIIKFWPFLEWSHASRYSPKQLRMVVSVKENWSGLRYLTQPLSTQQGVKDLKHVNTV